MFHILNPCFKNYVELFCIVFYTETHVHVHDLNATILHQLGFDHERLTYFFQGRHYRLTDVHGKVVKGVLKHAA